MPVKRLEVHVSAFILALLRVNHLMSKNLQVTERPVAEILGGVNETNGRAITVSTVFLVVDTYEELFQ